MVDIELDVYTKVFQGLREKYPTLTIFDETILAPSVFPCVCLEETDNFIYTPSITGTSTENVVEVVYEVNIYSNKIVGKKAECKELFSEVDDILTKIGLVRKLKRFVPLDDTTKARLFGRYTALVGDRIYRR